MNKVFILIALLIIVAAVYVFTTKKDQPSLVKISGHFEIDPVIGMLGHRGLYFFEDKDGTTYRIVGEKESELISRLANLKKQRATITGLVSTKTEEEPILDSSDKPTGRYRKVEVKILDLSVYDLVDQN